MTASLHQFPATSDALQRIAEANWQAEWDDETRTRILRDLAEREDWVAGYRARMGLPARHADLRVKLDSPLTWFEWACLAAVVSVPVAAFAAAGAHLAGWW